jgi:hypothetical protein
MLPRGGNVKLHCSALLRIPRFGPSRTQIDGDFRMALSMRPSPPRYFTTRSLPRLAAPASRLNVSSRDPMQGLAGLGRRISDMFDLRGVLFLPKKHSYGRIAGLNILNGSLPWTTDEFAFSLGLCTALDTLEGSLSK